MIKDDILQMYVTSTSGNMTTNEIIIARKIAKQVSEIVEFCLSTKVKLTKSIIDTYNGIVFPVFSNDNLESIVDRYLKLYPTEAKLALEDFKLKTMDNESGWTKGRSMKLRLSIPARIRSACMALDHNFWKVNNGKNLDLFAALYPKLATRSKNL